MTFLKYTVCEFKICVKTDELPPPIKHLKERAERVGVK